MSQSDSSFLEPRPSHKVRASWLVSLSLILAVLIELCPTEVDLMYGPVLSIGQSLFGSVPGAASILLLLGAEAGMPNAYSRAFIDLCCAEWTERLTSFHNTSYHHWRDSFDQTHSGCIRNSRNDPESPVLMQRGSAVRGGKGVGGSKGFGSLFLTQCDENGKAGLLAGGYFFPRVTWMACSRLRRDSREFSRSDQRMRPVGRSGKSRGLIVLCDLGKQLAFWIEEIRKGRLRLFHLLLDGFRRSPTLTPTSIVLITARLRRALHQITQQRHGQGASIVPRGQSSRSKRRSASCHTGCAKPPFCRADRTDRRRVAYRLH